MQWSVPELPASVPAAYVVAGIAAAIVGIVHLSKRPNLNAFPTVGSTSWLGSWWDGINYMTKAADVIQEGYRKHNGAPFKIATFYNWVVIVIKRAHVEQLRNARDDELSLPAASSEDFNTEFILGFDVCHNPYHITVMRSQLTRNIDILYPALQDEVVAAFDDILDLKDDGDMFPVIKNNKSLMLGNIEWRSVPVLTTIQKIVCRASNRSFVGLPLCRNPDYMALNIQHTIDSITGGLTIGCFPKILRPLAAQFVTNVPKNIRRGVEHIRPIVEERRQYLNEYGKDWTEKPHDLLSWLMEEGGPDATVEALAGRILSSNISAIHTTSNAFINTLHYLATNPQYVQPLREEVEAIVEEEGWSKTSLGKMRKLDSFLKECIRIEGVDMLGLARKAIKDFTFSDGTFIPKGTRINAGLVAIHHDDSLYENPDVFDPFRFADKSKEDGEVETHQFVATSPEYLAFGDGRHACPGRFFAGVELKTMLAHVVTTYDIKLEENMTRPRSLSIWSVPNSTAKVMFRKRMRQNSEH